MHLINQFNQIFDPVEQAVVGVHEVWSDSQDCPMIRRGYARALSSLDFREENKKISLILKFSFNLFA